MAARGACGECRRWQLDSTCCRVGLLRRGTRLRRRADGSWEVKLNDTGVRLVLATAEATVDDFVGAGAGREAALAPWTDVDAEDPDMCALCFVQVRTIRPYP